MIARPLALKAFAPRCLCCCFSRVERVCVWHACECVRACVRACVHACVRACVRFAGKLDR